MQHTLRRLVAAGVLATGLVASGAPAHAAATEVVTEASVTRQAENTPPTDDWVVFTRAGTPATAATFRTGPGTPPAGAGSLELSTATASQKVFLFNYDHVGAEQFGMLEALHPGRVDLGLGRAPGTDQVTALALRRTRDRIAADHFESELGELLGYFEGSIPDDHPFSRITATPGLGDKPDIWILGSSDYGARLAGRLGLPYSYAHHFSSGGTDDAVAIYREEFRPSERLAEPYLMLGVAVICAETDERAQWLAGPGRLAMVRLRSGRPGRYPTPEEAAAYSFTPHEKEIAKGIGRSSIVGSVDTVRTGLRALLDRTGADELMITTMTHGHEDRMESYRLVAEEIWRG